MRRPPLDQLGRPWLIGAAGAALALGLIGLVASEGRARTQGAEVALIMEAVDPDDLRGGRYVALNLTERLSAGESCPPGADTGFAAGRQGWVALRREGDRHRPSGAAARRADAARLGDLVVRGGLTCDFRGEAVTLRIGVERFHASRAEAERIERILASGPPGGRARPFALVSVGRDGRARLNGVRIDGRRVELEWF